MNDRAFQSEGPRDTSHGAEPFPCDRDLLFREAVRHHVDGRLTDAESCYLRVLAANPRHANSLYLLGLIADQTHRQSRAIDLIRQAITFRNDDPTFYFSLGNIHLNSGRPDEAIGCYERALVIKPGFVEAHNNLGNALLDLHRLTEAVEHLETALTLNPNMAETHNNLGRARHEQGKLADAITCFERALALRADLVEAYVNLGNAFLDRGDHAEAVAQYRRALALSPDLAEAHNNLGRALYQRGGFAEAMTCFERALALRPEYPEAHNNLGGLLSDLGRPEEALAHYERAVTLKPDLAEAHGNRGNILMDLGRFEEAKHSYETAVQLAPRRGRYHRALLIVKRANREDPHLRAMEKLALNIPSLASSDQIELHFALAKAYEDLEQHERSFSHLLQGNVLKRQSIFYNEPLTLASFSRIRSVFTSELMNSKMGRGSPSRIPVFIVGMMRSGTTLVEQILASHPSVFGAGELQEFSNLVMSLTTTDHLAPFFPEAVEQMPDGEIHRIATSYLDAVRPMGSAAERVTDKMPGNFAFLGLIHLALPNARIIHVRRNPVDTCLSCFAQLFTESHPYCYDLGELGRYYRAYEGLMEHWRQVLPPEVMLEVRYEDVVFDVEREARRIVAHCGLDWDDACLAFHETRRLVRTASAFQVRQPIYRTSVGRSKPYGSLLEPLLGALGLEEKGEGYPST